HRRQAVLAGGEQAPVLSREDLPVAVAKVKKGHTQAQGGGVGADSDIGGLVAEEVGLDVGEEIHAAAGGAGLEREAGVLGALAELAHASGGGVVVRDGGKVGADAAAHGGGAIEAGEIQKAAGGEVQAAEAQGEGRLRRRGEQQGGEAKSKT